MFQTVASEEMAREVFYNLTLMNKLPGDSTKITVLAIGGNAIAPPRGALTWERQLSAARSVARAIGHLGERGHKLILTHGNGPQVGAILLQNERASEIVPPNPLDACVAQSQAQIGYALQIGLQEELMKRGRDEVIIPIVTLVVVDPEDPAFLSPSKPIGPIYAEARREELQAQGWKMVKDARGGLRRVVPSPKPLEIVGGDFLRRMLQEDRAIVIAAGGGGIPVVRDRGRLEGVEAVVDKDLASSLLASKVGAELLIMVTDVPYVYLDYGTRKQKPLERLTVDEASTHLRAGQFPPGSMGPKVQAAVDFLRAGGSSVIIADLLHLEKALEGQAGTTITP